MAKYGTVKFDQALYGKQNPPTPPVVVEEVQGTPSLTNPAKYETVGNAWDGMTSVYVDANKTIQNNPFSIKVPEPTILNANRDEAIQGETELSTIAMGEKVEADTSVSMKIQGWVKITVPNAGSRFFRG